MGIRNQNGASRYEIVNYSLPKLHTGKSWYVDFVCFDPAEGKMRRKKYHLDGIGKVGERKKRAAELIAGITDKLRRGWNVWADANNSRQYTRYEHISKQYRKFIEGMYIRNAIKSGSYSSYLSYLNTFEKWLEQRPFPLVYVYQVDRALLSDFLDYMLLDKEVSCRTRNNYLTWLSTFCAWMVEKGLLEHNPATGMKKLKNETKFREQLTKEHLSQLKTYLERKNKFFLLACMMEYYCFIRPEELCSIRVGDIMIKEQKVCVRAEFAKNRKDGMVGLNDCIIKLMIDLGVFNHASGEYLFGGRDFRPSANKQMGRIFRETFVKVRKVLKWPTCFQFYSLKDTGIRDLANAEGIVVARDQARHSDISTTNKYLKGLSLTVHEETKHFKGGL